LQSFFSVCTPCPSFLQATALLSCGSQPFSFSSRRTSDARSAARARRRC
jgi:hypothetical protein